MRLSAFMGLSGVGQGEGKMPAGGMTKREPTTLVFPRN